MLLAIYITSGAGTTRAVGAADLLGKPSSYIRIFIVYALQEAHQLFPVTIICIYKKKDPPTEHLK